jgi:hypothetical protein
MMTACTFPYFLGSLIHVVHQMTKLDISTTMDDRLGLLPAVRHYSME